MKTIKNNKLPSLSGVPSQTIREWRRRGFIPTDREIDAKWVKVVSEVYKKQCSLAELFARAKKKDRI